MGDERYRAIAGLRVLLSGKVLSRVYKDLDSLSSTVQSKIIHSKEETTSENMKEGRVTWAGHLMAGTRGCERP